MTDVPVSLQEASTYLPPALAAKDLKEMYEELLRLDRGAQPRFYSPERFDFFLQGDSFESAPYPFFSSKGLNVKDTRVMLLSNTCDVSEKNERDLDVSITVAPIVKLRNWRTLLVQLGVDDERLESKIDAVKKNRLTGYFYLPSSLSIGEESLVLFHEIQSVPKHLFKNESIVRLETLSSAAHWILLLKISMHFCRLQEGVTRRHKD